MAFASVAAGPIGGGGANIPGVLHGGVVESGNADKPGEFWLRFIPNATRSWTFRLSNPRNSSVAFSVYTGASILTLTLVVSAAASTANPVTASAALTSGTKYYIAVSSNARKKTIMRFI